MRVEIAVVGGGVNGLAIARELAARQGADVAVFDDRKLGAASRAAAGLLGAQAEAADLPKALRPKAFPILRESRLLHESLDLSLRLVFRDVSTGAQDDLERATELARQMVCRFGMSEGLGPLSFERAVRLDGLPGAAGDVGAHVMSGATARLLGAEVRALVVAQYERARRELARRRPALAAVARELLAHETLERGELEALVRAHPPVVEPQAGPAVASALVLS